MSMSSHNCDGSEQALVRAIVAGEVNRFEELVVKHQDMIYALIRRQVSDPSVADDLAQEAFVRAFQNLERFRHECSFGTWLTRIALNTTNSYFASRRFKETAKQVSFDQRVHDSASECDESVRSEQSLAMLRSLIAELKPKYRDVIVLCSLEGKSYEEAASVLEIPTGTVCSRMNKALSLLRNKFRVASARGLL